MQNETIQYPDLDESDIKEALDQLGFKLSDRGAYWQTSAIWRNGDNPTAIQIYKDSGVWKDFVHDDKHQPFSRLVGKVLGTNDKKQISKYVKTRIHDNDFVEERDNRVKIQMDHIYNITDLKKLLPHHKFYLDKKISLETLRLYRGGYATAGQMNGRYTFPIFQENLKENIIGYSGRALRYSSDATYSKWKHIGKRKNWLYPLYIPVAESYPFLDAIKEKEEVVIVESIGDSLALTENKIFNHLVTFGLGLSSKQICQLVALNPQKIIIASNNDYDKPENIGLEAAIKNFIKLMDFFDISKLSIKLPPTNDFGDLHVAEDFDTWLHKTVDPTSQLEFILKKLESRHGTRIINSKKKRASKINFLQEYLED
mgnify:CR=1 FL=1